MEISENPLATDLDHILDHTRDMWNELRNERIFITGGTGFFGCWLLESFAWANERLGLKANAVVLTRHLDAFQKKAPHLSVHPDIHFHLGDIRSFEFVPGKFSYIIHAATEANASLNEEYPLAMFDTIVDGTHHTLEFARRCGAHKFLLTSSGAVYGRQPHEITHIPEDHPGAPDSTDPHSAYGEGKRAAETLCTLYAKQFGFEAKIARCFSFVGPYLPLNTHFAIGNFIRDGLKGGPIVIQGDGTPLRSYMYGADLAISLWTILLKGKTLDPLNVGSDFSISVENMAKIVARLFKYKPKIEINRLFSSKISPEQYVPSTKKAKDELGLSQWIDLESSISKTIHWYSDADRY